MALVGDHDFRNSARVTNLPRAIANGQPPIFEQLSYLTIPAPSHTVPLASFPRLAYYDTVDGIIKESRANDQNKLAEMVVLAGTATTLTINNCTKFTAHGYPLGRALFVAPAGGLTATPPSPYVQRVALAPHADYLLLYSDPPRLADISKLTLRIADSPFVGKYVAILGDSITQNATTWAPLNEFLGTAAIANHGISSTAFTWHPNNTGPTPMQATSRLNAIALNTNLILVFGGTNDYYYNIPLGAIGDINTDASNTTNTFYGAVNQIIDVLRARFPFAKIVFMTPLQRNLNYTEAVLNSANLSLRNYVDAIVAACAERSVPVIDLYKDFGMQRAINLPYFCYDGLHPDIRGYLRLQYFIATRLCFGMPSSLSSYPTPSFLWNVFDQSKVASSDHFWVTSGNDIIYMGNALRTPIFFVSSINTIEFTLDARTSTWVGLGGNPSIYTGVAILFGLITDLTPPTNATNVNLPAPLIPSGTLLAMNRFRFIKDLTGITMYGFDGVSFVQTHTKLQRANYSFTGWSSEYMFAAADYGFQSSNGSTPEGNWTMMKNVSVNGIPLFQAIQYGGI